MGDNSTSSTQTTTTTLPANQQRNVDVLLQGALDYFRSGGRQFFPGDIVADFDPLQTAGQNQIVNFSQGIGSDLVSDAISSNRMLMDPRMMDPTQNPYFSNVIGDLLTRQTQNFREGVLPHIRAGGISSGAFGGSPAEIAEALASDRLVQSLAEQGNALALGQQGLGLQAMLSAIQNAPGLFNLGLAPGQATAGVGDIRQRQAQNEIQGEVARHEFGQNEPVFALQLLRDLTGQAGTFGGTTTTEATSEASGSPINQVLGGALALASLWNPMTSIFGGLGNTGINSIGQGFLNQAMGPNFLNPYGGTTNPFQGMFPQMMGG